MQIVKHTATFYIFFKVCRSTRKQEIREIEVPELTVMYMTSTSPAPNKILCNVQMSTFSSTTMQELIVIQDPLYICCQSVYTNSTFLTCLWNMLMCVLSHVTRITFLCWDALIFRQHMDIVQYPLQSILWKVETH